MSFRVGRVMNLSFYKLTCNSLNRLLKCNLKMFNLRVRSCSSKNGKLFAERIEDKSLILLKGKDSPSFLQGLITNDVGHLVSESNSVYSMFLNNRGRVMFDTIVVKAREDDSFFLECDKSAVRILEKHLRKYKLRKKVSLRVFEDYYSIYSVYCLDDVIESLPQELASVIEADERLKPLFTGGNEAGSLEDICFGEFVSYKDPRLSTLGFRVIVPKDRRLNVTNSTLFHPGEVELYKLCRYWLGIAEGTKEIPFEQCFPLETNCDYLHGVSFHKGCYIGQELTARSHHTGVIRKRIMPLVLDKPADQLPTDITSDNSDASKKVGKLRTHLGKYGIGLLRIADCLKLDQLHVGERTARCFKPTWWPQQTAKLSKQQVV